MKNSKNANLISRFVKIIFEIRLTIIYCVIWFIFSMFQSKRSEGIGESQWIARNRGRTGGKNNLSGTLSDLAGDDVPLRKKLQINIDGELDSIYGELLKFLKTATPEPLIFDIHMLFHALGMTWNQPIVIYSRLVHGILAREVSRWNRGKEISGKIDEILEPKTYSDTEIKELTSWYASRVGSQIKIEKRWAAFLLHYIEQIASDAGYQWLDGKWQKYPDELRYWQLKKKKKR